MGSESRGITKDDPFDALLDYSEVQRAWEYYAKVERRFTGLRKEDYVIVNAAREYPPKTSMVGMDLFRKYRRHSPKVKAFALGLDLTKAPLVPRLALL